MRQCGLVLSGAHPDIHQGLDSGADYWAYASLLAVYVFKHHDNQREHIFVQPDGDNVTAICFNRQEPRHLLIAGASGGVCVRDVEDPSYVMKAMPGTTVSLIQSGLHASRRAFLVSGCRVAEWRYGDGGDAAVAYVLRLDAAINCIAQSAANPAHLVLATDTQVVVADAQRHKVLHRLRTASPTSSVAFDPLSPEYLLLADASGQLQMLDVASLRPAGVAFAKQPSCKRRRLAFVPSAPGCFVSASTRSSAVQVWNVSQPVPQQQQRSGGISNVVGVVPVGCEGSRLLLSFQDGSVGSLDVCSGRSESLVLAGHTNTIFDCSIATHSPDLLATASFDGTVRVWDMLDLSCQACLCGANSTLYSVSWSPDGSRIAASTGNGEVCMYDVQKRVLAATLRLHKASCYRVAWNPFDAELLASAGHDCVAAVFTGDGTVRARLEHGSGVAGVAWGSAKLLASCTNDGLIHIWNVSAPVQDSAQQVLKGHQARVFKVLFSPLLEERLLSVSDDCTARVWDLRSGHSTVLVGHQDRVRALMWHTEIPFLVLTGGWDGIIRCWDARTGTCLAVVETHHADVYGLTTHPGRPFAVASCSRDSTIRTWSLQDRSGVLLLKALLGRPWRADSAEEVYQRGHTTLLCGSASRATERCLASCAPPLRVAAAARVAQLLEPPCRAAENVWMLLEVLAGGGDADCGSAAPDWVPHCSQVRQLLNMRARALEAKALQHGVGGKPRQAEMEAAAQEHILAGNFRAYCELMVQLGRWHEALAVAPAVGLAFWRRLLQKHVDERLQGEHALLPLDVVLPLIACGEAKQLAEAFEGKGMLQLAFFVLAMACGGGYASPAAELPLERELSDGSALVLSQDPEPLKPLSNEGSELPRPAASPRDIFSKALTSPSQWDSVDTEKLADIQRQRGAKLARQGQFLEAACCHLAVGDLEGAIEHLLQGHEVLTAGALLLSLHGSDVSVRTDLLLVVAGSLSRRCEEVDEWELAGAVLQQLLAQQPQLLKHKLHLLAARFSIPDSADRALFFTGLGLHAPAWYQKNLKAAQDPLEEALFQLLGGAEQRCLNTALLRLKGAVDGLLAAQPATAPHTDAPGALEMEIWVEMIASTDVQGMPQLKRLRLLAQLAVWSAGKASRCGFARVSVFLLQYCRLLMQQVDVGVRPEDVDRLREQLQAGNSLPHDSAPTAGLSMRRGAPPGSWLDDPTGAQGSPVWSSTLALEDGSMRLQGADIYKLHRVFPFHPDATGRLLRDGVL